MNIIKYRIRMYILSLTDSLRYITDDRWKEIEFDANKLLDDIYIDNKLLNAWVEAGSDHIMALSQHERDCMHEKIVRRYNRVLSALRGGYASKELRLKAENLRNHIFETMKEYNEWHSV